MSDKHMDRGHLLNILIMLKNYECTDMSIRGFIDSGHTAVVDYHNKDFYIWDNGGEMGVEEINSGKSRYAPMTNFGSPLNALTMAYRINQILQGKEIDYDFKYEDEQSNNLLKSMGLKELMYEHFNNHAFDKENTDNFIKNSRMYDTMSALYNESEDDEDEEAEI